MVPLPLRYLLLAAARGFVAIPAGLVSRVARGVVRGVLRGENSNLRASA